MDARFPTYYLNDRRVLKLSADQFRLFVLANAWAVSNMTDGFISQEDLYLIPFADVSGSEALVQRGLWTPQGDGWLIKDFANTQTSAAQIEASLSNRRQADAARQKEKYYRDKKVEKEKRSESELTGEDQSSREPHVRIEGKAKAEAEAEAKAKPFREVLPPTPVGAAPIVSGSLAMDPDTWPTDDLGIHWRNFCEDNGGPMPVQRLLEIHHDLRNADQAAEALSSAYPGRRF